VRPRGGGDWPLHQRARRRAGRRQRKLGRIRSELRVAQERLLSTLDRLVHSTDIKPYLQDALVTQRQGRYVIPVRAEYKGSIDGIVHDQSASGATLFIEPLKVVQQNNAVRELELQEEREVRRILAELSDAVAEEAIYLRRNTQILAELDFTFAKAKYAYAHRSTLPEVFDFQPRPKPQHNHGEPNPAELLSPGSVIDLRRARHPLLDQKTSCPSISIWTTTPISSSSPAPTRAARRSRSRPSACWR
jgi:DNA mismatch repair protein MutS2